MLKKLKSLFIVEDESRPAAKKPAPQQETKKTQETPSEVDIDLEEVTPAQPGKPNPKFVEILLKAIESANAEGFDYLEFKQSLQSLSKMDMDEETKYKSAFAMAKTMGVTVPILIASADNYVKILKREDSKFGEALQNQKKKQIEDRKNEMKQLEKVILEKEKRILGLQKEIDEHKNKLAIRSKEINQAAAKVQNTKGQFDAAYNLVMGQITSDVEKIKKFIQ